MSKKDLVQARRFLILAVLFLLCVVLGLIVLDRYKDVQKVASQGLEEEGNSSLELSAQAFDTGMSTPFKRVYHESIILNEDLNQSVVLEQNLSTGQSPNLAQELETTLSFGEKNETQLKKYLLGRLNQNSQNLASLEGLNLEDLVQKRSANEKKSDAKDASQDKSPKNEDVKVLKPQDIDSKEDVPKLAIIIDDMANESHVKGLKALNLKLIPSFFPPDKTHENTAKLASNFDFYMVHLPLAAVDYKKAELDTLNPGDSEERISRKIEGIKKAFSNLKYINNHTGSLFTSDEKAMRKLYKAMKENDLVFVDSRTAENSKVKKVAREFGEPYIQRDVFLDNQDNVLSIKRQIQEAVNLARKKGFAIAIGHPRKNTFRALEESKTLLKNVKLVHLSEVYGE